jgi:hypothetical protein
MTKIDILSTAKDAISLIGLLAAAYFFLLRREFFPRAEFDLSMRIRPRQPRSEIRWTSLAR